MKEKETEKEKGPPQADQHGTYAPSALKHRLSQADQTVHRKFNPN
uniref:Uncharacterized protein n=1 Tax=Vitis vinifera TaxID=29760 RepID=F6H5T0_VITVI